MPSWYRLEQLELVVAVVVPSFAEEAGVEDEEVLPALVVPAEEHPVLELESLRIDQEHDRRPLGLHFHPREAQFCILLGETC